MSINEKHYWQMFNALQRIKAYDTPERLHRGSQKDWGLEASEAIEYAYENVLQEAKVGLKGIRRPKMTAQPTTAISSKDGTGGAA